MLKRHSYAKIAQKAALCSYLEERWLDEPNGWKDPRDTEQELVNESTLSEFDKNLRSALVKAKGLDGKTKS